MSNFDFTGKTMVIPEGLEKDIANPYLEETKGFMTASKLKSFAACPFSYYLTCELGYKLEDNDKVCFQVGTAIDDYVTYGRAYFDDKYVILPPNTKRKMNTSKIEFTNSDGACIENIIKEMKRQPLFDLHNPRFQCQKEIIAEFEGIKLRAKLDRIDPKAFEIRDTKTTRHADDGKKFHNNCMYATHDFGYLFSMAFYQGLANLAKQGDWKVLLEFFSKGADHSKFLQIQLPQDILDDYLSQIFGTEGRDGLIHFYLECKKHNYFPTHAELNPFPWSYLNSPFYGINPGAIQTEAIPFQDFNNI